MNDLRNFYIIYHFNKWYLGSIVPFYLLSYDLMFRKDDIIIKLLER